MQQHQLLLIATRIRIFQDSEYLLKGCSSTAVKSLSSCVCRPVFNAVMTRTLSGYQPILTLCDQDDKNPHRSNLNFRHVALAYQQYSRNSSILAENQQERCSRLKACTKIIAAVVSEVMEAYMVGPMLACKNFYSAFCTAPQHRCTIVAG